jgi:hypothetical protein
MSSKASTAAVAVRFWAWAALLRPLKHVLPLGRLVRLAHTRPRSGRSGEFERRVETYMTAHGTFPRRAPGNCLERSLAAYRMLCAAGAAPTLMVGFRRGVSDDVLGHVWVVVDGRPLAERPDRVSTYTPILSYDADGRPHATGGGPASLSGIRFA